MKSNVNFTEAELAALHEYRTAKRKDRKLRNYFRYLRQYARRARS